MNTRQGMGPTGREEHLNKRRPIRWKLVVSDAHHYAALLYNECMHVCLMMEGKS
jgi:hypothetical protein